MLRQKIDINAVLASLGRLNSFQLLATDTNGVVKTMASIYPKVVAIPDSLSMAEAFEKSAVLLARHSVPRNENILNV